MSKTALTSGAHHVGLTVPDLAKTRAFFIDTLGFHEVGAAADYPAAFVSDGTTMITLWQCVDSTRAVPFDRKNVVGLHHLALKVDSVEALDALYQKLTSTDGVVIEFAPEALGGLPARHMMCFIPGGIRIEFITPTS